MTPAESDGQPEHGPGRTPRHAGELRGSLGRLSSVNSDRHQQGDQQRSLIRRQAEEERLWFLLLAALTRLQENTRARRLSLHRDQLAGMTVQQLAENLLTEQVRMCVVCRYSLRGLSPAGRCPECGQEYRHELDDITPEKVIVFLSRTIDIARQHLEPQFTLGAIVRAQVQRAVP